MSEPNHSRRHFIRRGALYVAVAAVAPIVVARELARPKVFDMGRGFAARARELKDINRGLHRLMVQLNKAVPQMQDFGASYRECIEAMRAIERAAESVPGVVKADCRKISLDDDIRSGRTVKIGMGLQLEHGADAIVFDLGVQSASLTSPPVTIVGMRDREQRV